MMMRSLVTLALSLAAVSPIPPAALAQHIFLDVNGDGINSTADRLKPLGSTSIDIWIQTDRNRDGSSLDYARLRGTLATINQYEFILRSVGGAVEWGRYMNLQPAMDTPFGPLMNETDYYNGFGGGTILPPGKYKLGTLEVRVKSGTPRLVFASESVLWGSARTSFGSSLKGKDSDHTLKFTEDRARLGVAPEDVPGDWADASGLDGPEASLQITMPTTQAHAPSFAVTLSPNPANPEAVIQVQTEHQGPLRVDLFNLSGRLVRTLLREELSPAGLHLVSVTGPGSTRKIPSGVYVYRVASPEGSATGKVVILK